MRHRLRPALLIVMVAATLSCSLAARNAFANPRQDAIAQVAFGIKVAYKGLWEEALTRFKKAIQLDKTYSQAWNNLAIAYEQMGRFADARQAYEQALLLAPNDGYIRDNYNQFREIYDRQNKRRSGG